MVNIFSTRSIVTTDGNEPVVMYYCLELVAVFGVPSQGGAATAARSSGQHGLAAGRADAGLAAAAALGGAPRQRRQQHGLGAAALARAAQALRRLARQPQGTREGNVWRLF